jgi:serine/threonine-protein kinase
MTEPVPLPAGTLLAGKLRIVRLLGQGGMGAVYEVEHELTKHRRALKLLHPEMAKHPRIVARFLREASAAGRIANKHIVETFDAGTLESGEPYLVMEMLEGETLHAILQRKGRLEVSELADLLGQACDGVAAAHDAGIVHRDLKPENIFVMHRHEGPLVKLLDFGISRFDPSITGTKDGTHEGAVLGTPFYMSPEQIEGDKDLDARADVYALGVILYECVSGARPFEASALPMLSVLIHQGTPAPLASLRPDLPPAFVDVVSRAMARNRDARFGTARELGDALMLFGTSALDATLDGRQSLGPPRRSVPVRVSDHHAVSTPAAAAAAAAALGSSATAVAPSMAGSASSVAHEKRPSRGRTLSLAGLAVAMLAGVVAVSAHRASLVASPPLPSAAAAPPAPSAPPDPHVASVPPVTSSAPAAPAVVPTAVARVDAAASAPSAEAKPTAPRSPGATAKPAPSSRISPAELGHDNPYN